MVIKCGGGSGGGGERGVFCKPEAGEGQTPAPLEKS